MLRSMWAALGAAAFGGRGLAAGPRGAPDRWVVFYGANAAPAEFAGFDWVVLDPGYTGSLAAITAAGATTFGYLSLGEIRTASPLFAKLREPALLLAENTNWPGTQRVDARHPEWTRLILADAIPPIAARGFHGLFLDTLDTPPYLEEVDPVRFAGMRAAAVGLVRAIRRAYPAMPLIMNRGYALLPELVPILDAVVAESLLTTHDFHTRTYRWADASDVEHQLALLAPARARRPALPILSLDYWDPADAAGAAIIAARERALGHTPYIATILLDRVMRQP